MPNAPQYVSVAFPRNLFSPGGALPDVPVTGVLISNQATLDAVLAAAASAGVALVTSGAAPAGYQSSGGIVVASPTATQDFANVRVLAERQRIRQDNDKRAKLPLTTDYTAYTVNTTADGTLTKAYYIDVTAQTNSTTVVASGSQLATIPVDTGTPGFQKQLFKFGASPKGYLFNATSKDPVVIPANPNQNPLTQHEYRVRTNAPKIAFQVYRVFGGIPDGQHVFVDGRPINQRPSASSVGGGATDFITLTFADSQTRDIAIRLPGYAGFGATYVAPAYDVWKPTSPRLGLSLYTIGDSLSAPTVWVDAGNASGNSLEGLSQEIEDWLGVSEHYIDAVGGTGWVKRTTGFQGPNNNYQDRWPQLLRVNPDVVFVPNGAANDVFQTGGVPNSDNASIVAAVLSCFTQQRQQNPKTKFIWCDNHRPPVSGGGVGGNGFVDGSALRALLIPALASIGVYYIDTTGWLYGTGHLPSSTTGDGNADWIIGTDATHFTALGYRALKQRYIPKLHRILTDDGSLLNTVL